MDRLWTLDKSREHRGKTFEDRLWINPENIYINIGTKPLSKDPTYNKRLWINLENSLTNIQVTFTTF